VGLMRGRPLRVASEPDRCRAAPRCAGGRALDARRMIGPRRSWTIGGIADVKERGLRVAARSFQREKA
jgi:hypothetical protein